MTDLAQVLTSLLLIVAVAFVAPLVSWTIPKRLVPEVVLLTPGRYGPLAPTAWAGR